MLTFNGDCVTCVRARTSWCDAAKACRWCRVYVRCERGADVSVNGLTYCTKLTVSVCRYFVWDRIVLGGVQARMRYMTGENCQSTGDGFE